MTMTEEQLRAEFEAFISAKPYKRNIKRFPVDHNTWPGEYLTAPTQLAWEVWKAAWTKAELWQTAPIQPGICGHCGGECREDEIYRGATPTEDHCILCIGKS